MDTKVLVFSIFVLIFSTSTSSGQTTFDAAALDTQLAQITANLIAEETKIIQMLSNQTAVIQSVNLTLTNVPDVVTALNTVVSIMMKQMTAKNYAKYQPITTCTDVNLKITSINFDVQKFLQLANKAYANATAIYQQNLWISYYYSLNLVALGIGSSKQQNVYNIIQQLNNIVVEYLTYTNQLLVAATTEYGLGVKLSFFKQKYCSCPSTISSAVAGSVSTLSTNIINLEQPLITQQQKLIDLAGTALSFVKTAIPTTPQSSQVLQQTSTFLSNLATISDYSQLPWTNITSCSDLLSQIGYVTFKYWNYVQGNISAAQNFTLLTYYQNNLNSTIMTYSSCFSAAEYSAILSAIKIMIIMENLYLDYLQTLALTINRFITSLLDIQALGDNFCACNSQSGTIIAVTTTSSPTTTSTTSTTTSTTSTTTSTTSTTTSTTTTTEAPTTTSTTSTTEAPTTTSTTSTTIPITSTTLAPTTTTKSPKSSCQTIFPISAVTSTYLKSICYISTPMTHPAATSYCTSLGMSLYAITSPESYIGLTTFMTSKWPLGGTSILGNGISSGIKNAPWQIYSNQTSIMYSNMTWGTALATGQACATIKKGILSYSAIAADCATTSLTFACEFV